MKQYIKYILILLLALLVHNDATTTDNTFKVSDTQSDATSCFLSQAPTRTQQAIQDFYRHLTGLSGCMDCSDHTLVPVVKCILLKLSRLLAEAETASRAFHSLFHADSLPYASPQDYYIFRLHKIVI